MKIALVHELLTMKGGAESVLRVLANKFPDAPIFTLLYDERKLGDWFPAERVRTSIVQPAPMSLLPSSLRFNHHWYLQRFPRAVEAWDFSAYDIVVSLSSAFVHGIITNGAPKHLSYINAPARYLWDRTHDVLEQAGRGLLGPLKHAYLSRVFHPLRVWDAEAADRPDTLLAASQSVQRRIELYWRRQSDVLYPPIDDTWLNAPARPACTSAHYALVSSLVPYKRIDLAIEACNRMNAKLRIAGTGPAYAALKRLAGPTVEFLGYVPNDQLRDVYASATAVLFPGDEDFGLVPIEAMACGTPVIAYRAGGALETIVENETGVFFDEAIPASLMQAMETLDTLKLDPQRCMTQAKKFSRAQFEDGIDRAIAAL